MSTTATADLQCSVLANGAIALILAAELLAINWQHAIIMTTITTTEIEKVNRQICLSWKLSKASL